MHCGGCTGQPETLGLMEKQLADVKLKQQPLVVTQRVQLEVEPQLKAVGVAGLGVGLEHVPTGAVQLPPFLHVELPTTTVPSVSC